MIKKIEMSDGVLKTELKSGFMLYQSPIDSYGSIEYKLAFIASKDFMMTKQHREMSENHLNYMIRQSEKRIADCIRTAVFGFEQKENTIKLMGLNIKSSDKCPEGTCIMCPKDYHELMEKYCAQQFFKGIISDTTEAI